MEIIEQYIEGKKSLEECEDGIFINDNFIVVVDGATSKGNLLWQGKKSGLYAKEIICKEFESMDPQIDAQAAIEKLNQAIKNGYGDKFDIAKINVEERIVAHIIIFSTYRNEIWMFGDCQCLINGNLRIDPKKTDEILSEVRSLYNHLQLIQGKTQEELMKLDLGREYILPILKQSMIYANADNEYGYNTLDGFEINAAKCIVLKVKSKDEIVLASDGYPILKRTLKESEAELQYLIECDPLCINLFKSTKGITKGNKSFDDRAYIKFIV